MWWDTGDGGVLRRHVRVRQRPAALRHQLRQHPVRPQQLWHLRHGVPLQPDLQERRLRGPMSRLLVATVALLSLGASETLQGVKYRAVTLEPSQRKLFRVPNLERVTGASGRCIEEGIDLEHVESFWLEGTCSGVRTTLVWLNDGTRIHVMACAEEDRTPALVKLRQKLQSDVKGWKSVTACVRNGMVELWGWVPEAADKKKLNALELKYGLDHVKDRVDVLEEEH